MEKIDIIILTYNQAYNLVKAIESVNEQQVDCVKNIIVGNDCSTDNTSEILKQYKNELIIVNQERNLGASGNLASLLALCRGDYIAILEADDIWVAKDKLQIQVDFLRENKEYASCGCDVLGSKKLSWIKRHRKLSFKTFNGLDLCYQTSSILMRNPNKKCYGFLSEVHVNISDRILQGLLLSMGLAKRLKLKGVEYSPNQKDNLTKIVYDNRPFCYLTDIQMVEFLVYLFRNLGVKYSKSRFINTRFVIFGKTYWTLFLMKNKKEILKTIKKMAEVTQKTIVFWALLAPVCMLWSLWRKLFQQVR